MSDHISQDREKKISRPDVYKKRRVAIFFKSLNECFLLKNITLSQDELEFFGQILIHET